MNWAIVFSAGLVVTTAVAPPRVMAQPKPSFAFCVARDNLPMSGTEGTRGIDVDVAGAAAARMGATPSFVWLDAHGDSFEQAVADRRCDAAMGAIIDPGAMAGARQIDGVIVTGPYMSAGYRLIARRGVAVPATLDALGPDDRIALEGESIGAFTVRQAGHPVYVLKNASAVIDAVATGKAPYGYLWGPLASWMLRTRSDVAVAARFRSTERWGFGMAVRAMDPRRDSLDAAIRALADDGTLTRILAVYGVTP